MTAIDPERLRGKVAARLPPRVRWMLHDVPYHFDFTRAQRPLRSIEPADIVGGDIDESWRELLLFGETHYADGGGARELLGVRLDTGEVHGLDVERGLSPTFFLSSDLDRFIRTFDLFDAAIRLGTLPLDLIAGEAEKVDSAGFCRSEWRLLAEHILPEA
jgi:hypothetical protein